MKTSSKTYRGKEVIHGGMVGLVTDVMVSPGFIQLTVDFGKGLIRKLRPSDVTFK